MDLLLIRHGLPLRAEVAEGTLADPSLAEVGQEASLRLADWLVGERIDALYSSPMRRAVETVSPLAERLGLRPRVDTDLVEMGHLSNEYIPLEELKAAGDPRWKALISGGGHYEGIDQQVFRRTVVSAFERIIAAHPGECVLVSCHGGVINAFTSHILGVDALFVFEPAYTGISRFRAARSGERSIVSLNETAHLRTLPR